MSFVRLLLALFILMGSSAFAQTQFYVNPGGDDQNPGTLNMPWKTIQYAADNATPGSTVNIMAGTYFEFVSINVSGTSTNPITFQNYIGQLAIIDGSLQSATALIEITNQHDITIRGLELRNNIQHDAQGILVSGTSHHITLAQNKIHDIHFSSNSNDIVNASTNAQPLIVYGTDATTAIHHLVVDSNEIYNSRTGYSEGLAINGNVDGFEVHANRVHDVPNIGIDLIGHEGTSPNATLDQARNGLVRWNEVWNCFSAYATSAGIYVDGAAFITIENNRVHHNGWGIEVGCENIGTSATNITVRSNLIYENYDSGISIGGYSYPQLSGKVINSILNNNTLLNNVTGHTGNGELNIYYTELCAIYNNLIFAQSTDLMISNTTPGSGLTMNYNLYYALSMNETYQWGSTVATSLTSWRTQTGFDQNSLETDPLLVNVSTNDHHLQTTSPAIDAGLPSYALTVGETDLDTVARVQNLIIDIGADEYGTAVNINQILQHASQPLAILVDEHLHTASFTLPVQVAQETRVEVCDVNGRIVLEQKMPVGATACVWSIAELRAGVYLVRIYVPGMDVGIFTTH